MINAGGQKLPLLTPRDARRQWGPDSPRSGTVKALTDSWLWNCFSPAVSPMGNGTSRLYSALAKTVNSSAAAQHPEYLVSADPEHLEPIDPKELLEECRAVLHTRPPRYQRDFVDLRTDCSSSHSPIRVMQWNILAQGRPGAAEPAQ